MTTFRCGIYSFPKSGNTWMREIIRGLYNSSENISKVVPDVYQNGINGLTLSNSKDEKWCFYKSHSAKELIKYNDKAVKNDLIIYIVRNPLDVFCSQLNYLLKDFTPSRGGMQIGCNSIDEAKDTGLIDEYFSAFIVYGTLMPFFVDARSWMENTSYWIEKSKKSNRVYVVKYEDMLSQSEVVMKPILDSIGLSVDDLTKATKLADNRTNDGGKFFWKKQSGTHKQYLTDSQISKFLKLHEKSLENSGY